MKVVFAIEYYHPWVPGGSAWSLRLLARELRQRGVEAVIVTPNYGDAPAREEIDGVPVRRFPFWRRLPHGASLAPVRDHVNPLFHLRLARAVVSAARELGADVLHAQEKHALVGTVLAARWLRRPVFATLRDFGLICPITTCLLSHTHVPADCTATKLQRECAPFFLDRYVPGGPWRRRRVRLSLALLYLDARLKGALLRRADGVIGVSKAILDIFERAGRIPAGRGHVVYNLPPSMPAGITSDRTRRLAEFGLPDRPTVLFVGKTSFGKGFPVFVEAARLVTARVPEASFVAVGERVSSGPDESAPVTTLGSRSHAEVEALYALAEIVVHPAVWPEPFSRVPLEAASFSRPVIGTRIGGTPEAIDDEVTGVLVQRNDPGALAGEIQRLLADPTRGERMGREAAITVARKFSAERVVEQLLAAYRTVAR